MKNKWLTILILMGVFLLPGSRSGLAQWYYTLSFEQEFNSNPFRLPESSADQISEFSVGVQKDWQNLSVQYYGSYIRFNQNLNRNFYWHQFFLSGGDTTNWYFNMDNRVNRTDYNIYDYVTLQGGLNHRLYVGSYLWRIGINSSLNRFRQLDELNNFLLKAYASFNRSFQTRTSIIASISMNYKNYLNDDLQTEAPFESDSDILRSISILYGGRGGGGNGSGNRPGGPSHGGGTGTGADQWYYPANFETNNSAYQMVLSLRIAQSLATYTGIAAQYHNRIALNNKDRSIAGLVEGYQTESQIFDDPMGYEGQSLGIELTQIFPFQIKGKIAVYRTEKNYISQGIYTDEINFDNNVLREDVRNAIWFTFEKPWNINLAVLNWQINYQWIDNDSNSFWYQFDNQYVATGFQLDF